MFIFYQISNETSNEISNEISSETLILKHFNVKFPNASLACPAVANSNTGASFLELLKCMTELAEKLCWWLDCGLAGNFRFAFLT